MEEDTAVGPNTQEAERKESSSEHELFPSANSEEDAATQSTDTAETTVHSIDYCVKPFQLCGAWKAFSKCITRGCKWSTDGSCILTNSDDCTLRLFNLPSSLYQQPIDWGGVEEMVPVLQCTESGLIYDYAWFPGMSSADPATCCFASTSAGNPVHLWDAYTAELRCSYRPYNHMDEPVSAHSIAFDDLGEKLYCGFNKMVRVFDVHRPGRCFQERPTNVKRMGQPGIISCFAFSPEGLYAAGSYCKTVAVYDKSDGTMQFILAGHHGGVTHLAFSPDGQRLYSGGRKDAEILCWDLRNLGKVLYCMKRVVTTHQRMYFDLSRCGNYLVTGNSNGIVTVWDLRVEPLELEDSEPLKKPGLFFKAHDDCVNGVSLHPSLPIYATTSGQRRFPELCEDDNSDSFFALEDNVKMDSSLRLWWIDDRPKQA
ncbi:telomerase Cajal body protein 1 homolog [Haemaphysalis longicornis]